MTENVHDNKKRDSELSELALQMKLVCLARHQMWFSGDQEGVDIINAYFKQCETLSPRVKETLELADRSAAHCGFSFSKDQLEKIKADLKGQLRPIGD